MKLHRIWIFCLLLAAGCIVHGQVHQTTVSVGNTTTPCTPVLAREMTSPSCFLVHSLELDASSSPTSPAAVTVEITKDMNGISTTLFMDMLEGKSIPKLVITTYFTLANQDNTLFAVYKLELDNVYVTHEGSSESLGGSLPAETIDFAFQKLAVTYFQTATDSSVLTSTGTLTYDVQTHQIL